MWTKLGAPPQADEIEVTVLGPGFGESVVVHLGQGQWMIVDSCVDTTDQVRSVAPLKYLTALGVDVATAVKFIVATHWDDDHVKGISDIVEACTSARFVASDVFCDDKFTTYVEALSVGAARTDGGNVANMRRVLTLLAERDQPVKVAGPARQLCSNPTVRTWSPSDTDKQEFLNYIVQMRPQAGQGLKKAVPGTPNLTSVVITVEWADTSILLAADMERSKDANRGWAAVVTEAKSIGIRPADLVKIPHHGSENGHDDRMWDGLLTKMPISVIAPFGKGPVGSRPPKSTDIRRISKISRNLYLTARHTSAVRPKMDLAVERSIREGLIQITSKKCPMGVVRHRKSPRADWTCDFMGSAFRIK